MFRELLLISILSLTFCQLFKPPNETAGRNFIFNRKALRKNLATFEIEIYLKNNIKFNRAIINYRGENFVLIKDKNLVLPELKNEHFQFNYTLYSPDSLEFESGQVNLLVGIDYPFNSVHIGPHGIRFNLTNKSLKEGETIDIWVDENYTTATYKKVLLDVGWPATDETLKIHFKFRGSKTDNGNSTNFISETISQYQIIEKSYRISMKNHKLNNSEYLVSVIGLDNAGKQDTVRYLAAHARGYNSTLPKRNKTNDIPIINGDHNLKFAILPDVETKNVTKEILKYSLIINGTFPLPCSNSELDACFPSDETKGIQIEKCKQLTKNPN